jgi:hypothetical protein
MAVKFSFVDPFRYAVKIGKEINLRVGVLGFPGLFGTVDKIVNDYFRVNLFLDIQRRSLHKEVRPVLFVLAFPDKLGVKVGIAGIRNGYGLPGFIVHHGLIFGRGNVLAFVPGVGIGDDGFLRR